MNKAPDKFREWHEARAKKFQALDRAGKIAYLEKCVTSGKYPEVAKIKKQIEELRAR